MQTLQPFIVTLTPNPTLDLGTSVDVVEPDRKLRCEEPTREPGGGGLNVARAVSRLGGRTLALWAKGGATGELLHQLLDGDGLHHRPIPMAGAVRESFAVLERSSGRQFRFGMPGPTLPSDGLAGFAEEVARMDPPAAIVVGSGSLQPGVDEGFYAGLAEAAAARGARFVLDTQGEPLRRALAGGRVYLIKPNLRELSRHLGRELRDDAEIAAGAREIVARGGCRVALVSMGAAGALLVTEHASERIIVPTVPVRSRIGAGDSTVAGVAVALARGEPVERAARFGVAAGAAAVMTPGTELCRREDAERLFAGMG